ncbi:MAG: hypothetical protein ACLSCO_05525, partial [Gallintestinimicrobium sp.]
MGGTGEQTVVTGNPALLEGAKGSRFTSLTLHGKSITKKHDWGAVNIIKRFLWSNNNKRSNKNPNWNFGMGTRRDLKENALFYPYSSQTFLSLSKGDYVFSLYLVLQKQKQDIQLLGEDHRDIFKLDKARKYQYKEDAKLTFNFLVENGVKSNGILMIMLNSGSTSLPWEPYTGGAPSPSPSYPQEIESAGQDGEIGIEVGNNGYIQKGTYFLDVRQFPLKKGYTYYIKGEKIIGNDINCFVLNEYNKNFKNSAELFNYGYTTKKLTIPNSTGIVDEECRMPMRYDKDGYTFTVKAEGLYLYQAVNEPAKNTDEFYVGYTPNIVNEEYKKQTLIVPTPNGLPGIPVSSGGNYTDEKGQQWVADEIDLARGERVKWIGEYEFTGKENVADFGLRPRVRIVSITMPDAYRDAGNHGYLKAVMSNKYKQDSFSNLTNNINLIARGQQNNICISIPVDIGIEDFKTDLSNQYASGRPVKVFYKLATPIRTPLLPETIAAYKTLRTYSPTTTVINYAGAGMSAEVQKKVRLNEEKYVER